MKQGALIYDRESSRYNIRFGLDDYHGGLHCGECFDVFADGKWKPTRIEMSMGQRWSSSTDGITPVSAGNRKQEV